MAYVVVVVVTFLSALEQGMSANVPSPGSAALAEAFYRLCHEEADSLPSDVKQGIASPLVAEALEKKDVQGAIGILKEMVAKNGDNIGLIPIYKAIQKLYRDSGDDQAAQTWGRLEMEAVEKAFGRYSAAPESILLVELYTQCYVRLPKPTQEDYQRVKAFLETQSRAPEYAEYHDLPLVEICELEYWSKNYKEVLAACDRVDRWYEGRPEGERGRAIPDLWRARALFRLGKRDEAAGVLERLLASKNPSVMLKDAPIAAELQAIREGRDIDSPVPVEVCSPEVWKPLVEGDVLAFRLHLGRLQYQITRPEGVAAFKLALSEEWWTDPDPKWSSGRQIWGGQLISDTSNGPRKLDVIVAQRGKTTYECLPVRIGTCSVKADSLLARLISAIVEKRLPESNDQKVVADTEIAGGFTPEELDRIDSDELRELVKGGLPEEKQTSPPATQKLSAPAPQSKARPSSFDNLIAKGCGGQHSVGCAGGTGGGGCGAVKVAELQGAGCGCGSGGCGGPAGGALARPSTPKPLVDQAPWKRDGKDSLLVTSAGASCCSTTAAKPAAASKAIVGCGQGCGCGCGAAPGPEPQASTSHQAPVPAAK